MEVDTPAARTNSNPDDGFNAALTRAEGLWFEDCGLIIQAEKTLFRISRDYLASQSPVFKDMLTLPSPKEADRMDGCPFVFLPDSAEDVTVFLKALMFYDFFEPYPAPTTLPILFGTLRMSHKYEVDPLRKRALTHISSLHPMTLRGYETFETPWWYFCSTSETWLAICLLARQLHIDWILPVAFFRVSQFARTDAILSSSLELCDKISCIDAALVFEKHSVPALLDFLWTPLIIDDCEFPDRCTKARLLSRRLADKRREDRQLLEVWCQPDWQSLDVCKVCLLAMALMHLHAKQSFWEGLPALFGLPDWGELALMKAEAFK
ncbi:hypothetical protein DFH06DRAFT_660938 [Mycena polygramma]|nr:hypothetical protein DFH06DRAFT_660938 [Mycena polygramma]